MAHDDCQFCATCRIALPAFAAFLGLMDLGTNLRAIGKSGTAAKDRTGSRVTVPGRKSGGCEAELA